MTPVTSVGSATRREDVTRSSTDALRIVITRPLPAEPIERFKAAGFRNVWINPVDRRMERRELLEAVRGAHGVLVTPADMLVNAEFYDAAGPQLKVVSAYAVGVDNIDVAEAKQRGIVIGHTPHAVTEPTADMAWMLLLAAARRARQGLDIALSGQWTGVKPCDPLGQRIVGKTLLIVGAGRIGHAMARRSIGWGMPVLYNARTRHVEFEQQPINGRRVELDDGLRQADFVSIHCPLTPETRHLINARRLALMKPTAILVNTARGPVVDEAALAEALKSMTILAAGLDVYEREPEIHPDLLTMENVFLMPHWGSTTVEDRQWMTQLAVDNIVHVLRGEPALHAVT
jgi:lactate dehydrogenase-like 2-hydroxyacid dehydrogenase